MQVSREDKGPCTVVLDIQVDPETVDRAFDRAYREFSAVTNVPGFRPGKAPRAILERYVSRDRVLDRVRQNVAGRAYQDALRDEKITPFADPEVEFSDLAEGQPWQFKAVVPMPPKVTLGELQAVRVERPVYEVTDADVNEQVEALRREHARMNPVEDRGLQAGDTAIAEMRITMHGDEPQEAMPRSLIRMGNNIPGFDDAVAGMTVDEERSFDLTFPEDYDDAARAGKQAHFDVRVSRILETVLPDLTDEWVHEVAPFQTVDELRAGIRERRGEMLRDLSDRLAESRVVEALVASSHIEFPDVMVEEEMEAEAHALQQDLERREMSFDRYLEQIGQTREQHEAALRASAEGRVRTTLVLRELARQNGVEVSDQEIDAEFASLATGGADADEQLKRLQRDDSRRTQVANTVARRKLRNLMFTTATVTDGPASPAV